MIASTPAELREALRAWPVADLRQAIRAALPELDAGMEAVIADWLARDGPEAGPPLGAEQVAAIWRALYQRAQ
jgi:hypothetical protein